MREEGSMVFNESKEIESFPYLTRENFNVIQGSVIDLRQWVTGTELGGGVAPLTATLIATKLSKELERPTV